MRTFSKIILMIIAISSILVTDARSQEKKIDHKNFIGLGLSQIIFVDFRFSYERKLAPAHGVIIQLSYKPAFSVFTDATIINLGQEATGWCYRNTASWYYASIGYRYYFNPNKTIYVSPEFFYKKMLADNIIYSYGTTSGTSNTYEVRSMETDLIGGNLLIGKKMRIKFNDNFNMGLDIFTGITFRYKDIFTTTYGKVISVHSHDSSPRPGPIPITDTPDQTSGKFGQFSVQFGIILFSSWK